MPYVEGESLRERLRREASSRSSTRFRSRVRWPTHWTTPTGTGWCIATSSPRTSSSPGGHARVADFGVARALEAAGGGELTQAGMAVGTPAYMSPEQASGRSGGRPERHLRAWLRALRDAGRRAAVHRADPAGRHGAAIHGDASPAACHARPSALACGGRRGAGVGAHTGRPLRDGCRVRAGAGARPRCWVADWPEDRGETRGSPESSGLRTHRRYRVPLTVVLGLGFVLGLGALFAWRRSLRDRSGEGAASQRLVVLPFRNLGSSEDEYFADGLTEAITSRLGSLRHLRVIGQQSAMQYKGTGKPPNVIGREVGAQYLLTGTIRYEKPPTGPSRLRVSPSLIRAADGTQLWAAQYDTVLAGVFEVQSLLAKQVAGALDVAFGEPEQRALEARPTDNLEAYESYLLGRQASDQAGDEPRAVLRAVSLFQRAVALDPKFALAYAHLAEVQLFLWFRYMDRDALRVIAGKRSAEKALRLDPALPEAHVALGFYYYHGRMEYEPALEQFFQAERSQPSNPETLAAIGYIRRRQGRWEEALNYFKRVQQMDPRSVNARSDVGDMYWLHRRYGEALAWYDSTAALGNLPNSVRTARALSYLGAARRPRPVPPGPTELGGRTGADRHLRGDHGPG